jgi:MFS family permease
MVWLVTAYNFAPVELLEMLGFTALINFACLMILGVSFINHSSTMIEMSFLARLQKKHQLYTSKLLVLTLYSLGFSLIGVLYPILAHIANGFTLLERALTFSDILGAFIAMLLASLAGAFGGSFMSTRIVKNESWRLLLCVLWVMIAIFRGSIILEIEWLRYVLWAFPPIHELARDLIGMDYFQLSKIWFYFLYAGLYIAILAVGYVKLMMVKRVE